MKTKLWIAGYLGASILFLSGCGGGGSNNSGPVAPEVAAYLPINIEGKSFALTNDGVKLNYITETGELYALNTNTGDSTYIDDVGSSVNGLAYKETGVYYYSVADTQKIYQLHVNTAINTIANIRFPDGLDFYQNKIYSVTNDASGVLTVLDAEGNVLGAIDTGIPDITGIAHWGGYLYILAEDGDIYQTNPQTGESHVILVNDNLFERENSKGGLEGITVLDGYIYVSNASESRIYKINVSVNRL